MQAKLFTVIGCARQVLHWGGFEDLINPSRLHPYVVMSHQENVIRLNNWIETRELFTMSVKSRKNASAYSAPDFVNARLSRDEKEQFKVWLTSVEMTTEAIMLEQLAEGIKVSFSFDEKNDSYICSMTPRGEMHVNAGKCLTSRAPTPFKAFMVNVFKIDVLFSNSEWHDLGGDDDIS